MLVLQSLLIVFSYLLLLMLASDSHFILSPSLPSADDRNLYEAAVVSAVLGSDPNLPWLIMCKVA